jgi:hypothetical protein
MAHSQTEVPSNDRTMPDSLDDEMEGISIQYSDDDHKLRFPSSAFPNDIDPSLLHIHCILALGT